MHTELFVRKCYSH